MNEYINLTNDNIGNEHLCCIIRSKVKHPGVEMKRSWLKERLKEGHVFRKLNVKGKVFVEYAPLETAWVPIEGKNYYYIYCLWVDGEFKHKGYGKELMNYVIDDAKKNNLSGICLLGSIKKHTWLQDFNFAKTFGFKVVDSTSNGYQLYTLSFDETYPKFKDNAKTEEIPNKELTIYYDMQCPFVLGSIEMVKKYCQEQNIQVNLIEIKDVEQAKNLPCVFNNYAVFYNGKFQTVNILDLNYLQRILKKGV